MLIRTSCRPLVLCAALLLVACAPSPPPAPVERPATVEVEVEVEVAGPHFVDAVAIQDAVILGDLGTAQEVAKRLAAQDAPRGMDAGRAERVRVAATAASTATDLAGASAALGAVATQCGGCHRALETPPVFELPRPPSHDPEVKPHMARHAWAVSRMWEGLISGSQSRWNKGLSALAEETIGPDHIAGLDKLPENVASAAQRVHELAAEGLMASDATDRERIYADLIAACGSCHASLGTGPGKGAPTP